MKSKFNSIVGRFVRVVVAIGAAAVSAEASARSLLYYFDFDSVENDALVYEGTNKGTGNAAFTLKQNGTDVLGHTAPGAFGSDHAFVSSTLTSLWLGDGVTSFGCGTTQGFTISFWLKASASHDAWGDFFGFKVGDWNYRFEYRTNNSTEFTVYSKNKYNETYGRLESAITQAPAGEWTHVALVFAPDADEIGLCSVYVGGEKAGTLHLEASGTLQRLNIGSWVIDYSNNGQPTDRHDNTKINNTGIDELAVFDYPVTEEQVKWLGCFRPALAPVGQGREMPFAWHFSTTNATTGVLATNSGTSPLTAVKNNTWNDTHNGKAVPSTDGALGSKYSMETINYATWTVSDVSSLGATAGSGWTLSFWLKAPSATYAWADIFTYVLGGQSSRFEWDDSSPANIRLFGNVTDESKLTISRTVDAWNHLCVVWNRNTGKADCYSNGTKVGSAAFSATPSDADALKKIRFGRLSINNDGSDRQHENGDVEIPGVLLDEFAMFNHSLSPDQVSWLGSHMPELPALDATNVVRTVSADGSWYGGTASWSARKWNGSSWISGDNLTIWPVCEDVDVDATISFAAPATITNDTFVTCKRLALSNGSGAASVTSALRLAGGSMFAPQTLEVGDGVRLVVQIGEIDMEGSLAFGTDAKIVFDTSECSDDFKGVAMKVGSISLPGGETDILSHFAASKGSFDFSLSEDGKTLSMKKHNGLVIIFK